MTPPKPWCICWCGVSVLWQPGVSELWHSPVSVSCDSLVSVSCDTAWCQCVVTQPGVSVLFYWDSPSLGVCRSKTLCVNHWNRESLSLCLPAVRHWMLNTETMKASVCVCQETLNVIVKHWKPVCLPGARHWMLSCETMKVCVCVCVCQERDIGC